MAAEIRHHIEELADRLRDEGWEGDAADREAVRRFGDIERIRREMVAATRVKEWKMRIRGLVPSIVGDLRYALRGMQRSPGFASTVIVTLALGAGAAVSVFTVLDALLLRPLPYEQPDQLVTVSGARTDGGATPYIEDSAVREWRRVGEPLSSFAQFMHGELIRTDGGEPQALRTTFVTVDLDDVLGMHARVGRTFTDEDAGPGTHRVMLGNAYWKSLGSDPSVVGSELRLEGIAYEVVGVLPPDFKFPVAGVEAKLWVAIPTDRAVGGRDLQATNVVARMRDGLTVEAAQARLDAIAATLDRELPRENGTWRLVLSPVTGWRANPDLVRGVYLLAGAVLLMLLVALANSVNLLLLRATDRAKELAVRLAIGSGRARLMRQLVTEGVVMGIISGVLGVMLAEVGVRGLVGLMPFDLSFSSVYSFRIETRVLAFAFIVSLVSGAVLGTIPGVLSLGHAKRFDLLKGRSVTRRRGLTHNVLAAAEIALAMGLLTGAGMLANSLVRLSRVDTGFDAHRVALLSLSLPPARYATSTARAEAVGVFRDRINRQPGLRATVADGVPPNTGFSFGIRLQAEGSEPIETDPYFLLPIIGADPDYLDVLGGEIVAGRDLESADIGTQNVLIDEPMARALFGGGAAGNRFRIDADQDWLTVVGVYRHLTMMGLDDRAAPFSIIRPRNPARSGGYVSFAIRAADPEAALSSVRTVVHEIDPHQPVARLETARSAFAGTIDKPRFLATVMIALAVTAMLLSALGVYGVLSYAVTQRRREMGVRLAIGAPAGSVQKIFVRRGLLVALAGVAGGALLGIGLTRLAGSLLFGVQPGDPLTMSAVATLMIATAALASFVPARRATRVDPIEILRAE